jgi:hypothetical protein
VIRPDEAHEGGIGDIVAPVSMPIVGCAVAPSLVEIGHAVDHIPAARENYRRMVEDLRNAQIDREKGRGSAQSSWPIFVEPRLAATT